MKLGPSPLGPTLLLALAAAGCEEEVPPIIEAPPPFDAGCVVGETARTYDVYFVIDVSGSMADFLTDLGDELANFALGFPERDQNDDRVIVNYYVVAFVNDVRFFPTGAERMTSHIAVNAAIQEAIATAEGNRNLNGNTPNADAEENLLDALGAVVDQAPSADSTIVMIATDQMFKDQGETLSGGITVRRSYEEVFNGLQSLDVRVHAFVPSALPAVTQPYQGVPAVTDLGNGQIFDLADLTGANDVLRGTLEGLAQDATCNPTVGGVTSDAAQ